MFKLGLVINPVAGLGGSVALKGSDNVSAQALALGAQPKANDRTRIALETLLPYKNDITIYCADKLMGQHCAQALGFQTKVVYHQTAFDSGEAVSELIIELTSEVLIGTELTSSSSLDTQQTIKALLAENVDVILFAGGDGTARDISAVFESLTVLENSTPVLGIPAGCKIHSGVYAVTPTAAGRVVEMMINHQLVSLTEADVMDIDESLFREGIVKAKRYSEMLIPQELQYMQAVKSGGKESDELVLQDIAAYVIDQMEEQIFIVGSGSTTGFIMEELGLDYTLLGVDAVQDRELIANDLTEQALWQLIENAQEPVKLIITLIGGQGHIFGRGNQQLSPRVIKAVGIDNIILVATKAKLTELNNKPLIADTGDAELDKKLSGFMSVVTGYNDHVLYPVASPI